MRFWPGHDHPVRDWDWREDRELSVGVQFSIEGTESELVRIRDELLNSLPFVDLENSLTNANPYRNWRMKRRNWQGVPQAGHDKFPEDSQWSHKIFVYTTDWKQLAMMLKLSGAHQMTREQYKYID